MNSEYKSKSSFKQEFKKRCYNFSINILKFSENLRNKRINWPIIDQLVRSATSIGANVVEGGNSTSKKEFINYFQIALKSASETLYWLSIVKEVNNDNKDNAESLIKECSELKKLVSSIILNTKQNSRF